MPSPDGAVWLLGARTLGLWALAVFFAGFLAGWIWQDGADRRRRRRRFLRGARGYPSGRRKIDRVDALIHPALRKRSQKS